MIWLCFVLGCGDGGLVIGLLVYNLFLVFFPFFTLSFFLVFPEDWEDGGYLMVSLGGGSVGAHPASVGKMRYLMTGNVKHLVEEDLISIVTSNLTSFSVRDGRFMNKESPFNA